MEENQKLRLPVVLGTVLLIGVFLVGLRWVFTFNPNDAEGALFYLFDYAVGLTMIFLPCTLPLAFVIVPLAMGKGYARGIGIAISFALGVTITLSFYGALLGYLGGQFIGQAETAKNIMYAFAGFFGFMFALGDIGLTRFRMPTYGGAFPGFIQRQQEFLKAGLLGLFLGNIGVGCPNPLFNGVIIPQVFLSGSAFHGWLIMFVQALGRVTPLFILAFLAILGINATSFLIKHRTKVEHSTGWVMVFVAGFLFSLGAFTHDWYVYSGIHTYLEEVTQEEWVTNLLGKQLGELGHTHAMPLSNSYLAWGSYVMVTIWMIPFVWMYFRKRREINALAYSLSTEKTEEKTNLTGGVHSSLAFIITLGVLLYFIFGYYLPNRFLTMPHRDAMDNQGKNFMAEFTTNPEKPAVNQSTLLTLTLKDDMGQPLTGLQIEHERLLHFILVSEDLTQFMHVHAEDYGPITEEMRKTGTYAIDVVFPKAGTYAIAVNYNHAGHELVARGIIMIAGKQEPVVLTKDLYRKKKYNDLSVSFETNPGEVRSGRQTRITYTIKDLNGNPVSDLEPYLAAPMHIAVWSFDLEFFTHTHGEVPGLGHVIEKGTTFGPIIDGSIVFPWPGFYKIIGEFARGGKIYTTSFVVDVKKGSGTMTEQPGHTH